MWVAAVGSPLGVEASRKPARMRYVAPAVVGATLRHIASEAPAAIAPIYTSARLGGVWQARAGRARTSWPRALTAAGQENVPKDEEGQARVETTSPTIA